MFLVMKENRIKMKNNINLKLKKNNFQMGNDEPKNFCNKILTYISDYEWKFDDENL